MTPTTLFVQLLNGLASASLLFVAAAGLSLIFGVTRIVNFAHGSLYMLGAYLGVALMQRSDELTVLGFWGSVVVAAAFVAVIGAAVEMLLLRRIYAAPELLQLLATFALVLVIKDVALKAWGPEDILGPRAPGLADSIDIGAASFPQYDLLLIALGPVVLFALTAMLRRTRFGLLVRAATQDRDMVAALGVNERWLFTGVFALGAFLAAFGGAIALPREPANLNMDLAIIADLFVVVVLGGMGSIAGAYVAAVIISLVKALCIAVGDVSLFGATLSLSKFTLVAEFVVMALVLVLRPYGLFGKPAATPRGAAHVEAPLSVPGRGLMLLFGVIVLALVVLPWFGDRYAVVLATDILIFALFAVSLHVLIGPAGLHSFGHAAYFGLGAYGAALAAAAGAALPISIASGIALSLAAALLFGWVCVRLSGIYFAMLTLAFAQIVWSVVFQWDEVTGGSNGIVGVWPPEWLGGTTSYFHFVLLAVALSIAALWRMLFSPFGYSLRAARDSPLRAQAIGIDVKRQQWFGFAMAGAFAGLAGTLFAFSKGSISPESLAIPRSVDGLVMVLLGGVQSLLGPVVGAALFTWLQDSVARATEYWRAGMGAVIIALVLLFPKGIMGVIEQRFARAEPRA